MERMAVRRSAACARHMPVWTAFETQRRGRCGQTPHPMQTSTASATRCEAERRQPGVKHNVGHLAACNSLDELVGVAGGVAGRSRHALRAHSQQRAARLLPHRARYCAVQPVAPLLQPPAATRARAPGTAGQGPREERTGVDATLKHGRGKKHKVLKHLRIPPPHTTR